MKIRIVDRVVADVARLSRRYHPTNALLERLADRILPQVSAAAGNPCPPGYGLCNYSCQNDYFCGNNGYPIRIDFSCAPSQYACDHNQDIYTSWGCWSSCAP